jgi:hypothetical protein
MALGHVKKKLTRKQKDKIKEEEKLRANHYYLDIIEFRKKIEESSTLYKILTKEIK